MTKRFTKILIANRGEIALRVMRTCREMGIKTVAVFSEADRRAGHVLFADEAYYIGPSPSNESYLKYETILAVALKASVSAIHPGYGFLSENTDFAAKVTASGITFIGPPSEAIRLMGDKTMARQAMIKANIPVVPGTEKPIDNTGDALRVAENIGFPVLIKAAGGGGGKGMRIVEKKEEFMEAVSRAQGEAKSAFSDSRVYIEKYLEEPHHIEFQILADAHGNIVHLGERECSIQRRYQKVVEESPSVFIDDKIREAMGKVAISVAKSCQYLGAGTVEFLVDKHRQFYFLEMNTRLQVEHPVTEMVTGIDLVAEQIRIAEGHPISFKQEDIRHNGHAIECRIYAEDAKNNFAPSIGTIHHLFTPDGPGTRLDSALYAGQQVTPYYDPMLGKLITWGRNREDALRRMDRALSEFFISGIETSISFCRAVINHPRFQSGTYDTHFYKHFCDDLVESMMAHDEETFIAAAGTHIFSETKIHSSEQSAYSTASERPSNWVMANRKGLDR